MKANDLLDLIGNTDDNLITEAKVQKKTKKKDEYVTEYAEKAKSVKAKALHHFRTWGIIAACLALVIICTPTFIHIFNPSGIDDPRSGEQYNFSGYSELCSVLPEGSIITNVPNSENSKIEAYAICPEGTADFADYNNYSYLGVDISYDDGTGVNIFCTVKSKMTAKEYVESKPLIFPPDKTSTVTVENCQVYYADFENDNTNGVNAVFSIDGSLYDIKTTSFNHEELVQYIEKMLK